LKTTQKLHELGQSLWIDNITRDLLNSGLLKHSIDEWSVTGLISNPTAFGHAIRNSTAYDATIRKSLKIDISGKKLFFELALEDLRHAADLFRPIYDQTDGVDGWVSIEVSPLLIHDTTDTLTTAKDLYRRARRPNIFIASPGTKKNLPVVEEAIFAGVPVNVTLLFTAKHYLAQAEAYMRGLERRIDAGLDRQRLRTGDHVFCAHGRAGRTVGLFPIHRLAFVAVFWSLLLGSYQKHRAGGLAHVSRVALPIKSAYL
jgi:transaldolase